MKQTRINPYTIPGVISQMNNPENISRINACFSASLRLKAIYIFVCDYFKIKESTFFRRKRTREMVERRYIFMTLAVDYTQERFEDIAEFSDRNHSTVSHAVKLCKDGPLMSKYNEISRKFSEVYKIKKVERKHQKVN